MFFKGNIWLTCAEMSAFCYVYVCTQIVELLNCRREKIHDDDNVADICAPNRRERKKTIFYANSLTDGAHKRNTCLNQTKDDDKGELISWSFWRMD